MFAFLDRRRKEEEEEMEELASAFVAQVETKSANEGESRKEK